MHASSLFQKRAMQCSVMPPAEFEIHLLSEKGHQLARGLRSRLPLYLPPSFHPLLRPHTTTPQIYFATNRLTTSSHHEIHAVSRVGPTCPSSLALVAGGTAPPIQYNSLRALTLLFSHSRAVYGPHAYRGLLLQAHQKGQEALQGHGDQLPRGQSGNQTKCRLS